MADVFQDYIAGKAALAPFYCGMPGDLFNAPPSDRSWDPDLVTELQGHQIALGGRAMVTGNEAAIVTGQQAGLLTGPLYTIYKAITAILLARQLESRFNVPYLPVFWVHHDDHDFEEVASTTLLTKNHDLLELRYTPGGAVDGLPVGSVPAESSLHAVIDRTAQAAQGSEFRKEIQSFLHESLDSSRSYGEWMARIMARLFQGTPLVLFSPALPMARRISAAVFAKEIDDPSASTMLARHAEERLTALGYAAQVSKRADECSFFLIVNGRRRKVEYRNGTFTLPEIDLSLDASELRQILNAEPERFSANVLLRGVVQQTLMPAAAYVGGPGEVGYWSQLREIFARHDTHMPIVYPRVRATLTNAKTKKLAEELGLTLDDLLGNPDATLDRAFRNATRTAEMDYLRKHRVELETAAEAFSDKLAELNPVAGSMGASLARTVHERLDEMERALARQDELRRAAIEKQLQRLQHTLAPHRKTQERVINVFSFLFSHGWELIPRLLQELDVQTMTMQEIEL